VIVSMGPQHTELRLASNMWGAEVVPQPAILPHVDLVITHGGNNTVTESLSFGKPMVLHPLFWDQHDNAQRIHETGFGRRIPAYTFRDEELLDAVAALLADRPLAERLAGVSAELQARPGTVTAADRIGELAAARS
jgi:UDP:flavonoid glycosyltransferase YjiC (YdhE family)